MQFAKSNTELLPMHVTSRALKHNDASTVSKTLMLIIITTHIHTLTHTHTLQTNFLTQMFEPVGALE